MTLSKVDADGRVSPDFCRANKELLMPSKNAERLAQYKEKMRAAGFKRLSVWVCPELALMLTAERKQHECGGRTLERLLLGESRKRPPYRDASVFSDH
jgi:G:T-mismatch repair DNA endonuclease (very short patch repair protein)